MALWFPFARCARRSKAAAHGIETGDRQNPDHENGTIEEWHSQEESISVENMQERIAQQQKTENPQDDTEFFLFDPGSHFSSCRSLLNVVSPSMQKSRILCLI
jgi:hypothetical protein